MIHDCCLQPDTEATVEVTVTEQQEPPPSSAKMDTSNEASYYLTQLQTAVNVNTNKYELASMFAHCEARQAQLSDEQKTEFSTLLVSYGGCSAAK